MSRMSASDLVRYVRKGMGSPSSVEWTDVDLLRLINTAAEYISAENDIAELEDYEEITTSDSADTYEFTSAQICRLHQEAKNTTEGEHVQAMKRKEYNRLTMDTTTETGSPEKYLETEAGSNGRKQVQLWPYPDGVYVIRFYFQKFETLVLSPAATSFTWPQPWDMVAVERAVEIGLALDNERAESGAQAGIAGRSESRLVRTKRRASQRIYHPASRFGKMDHG